MYKEKTIGAVVPAYNVENLIGRVIDTMPAMVDKIVIVDDCSQDKTVFVVQRYVDEHPDRVVLIRHESNQGVGGAIATGYKWCRDQAIDATVVMAGDNQMDPTDLLALLDPVVNDEVDYSKGNRLITGKAWNKIPRVRYLGNSAMSLLTKVASGYWHIADSQSGYTVANLKVLQTLDLESIYKRYGMPNDMLVSLNINNFRVRDVPTRPVYGIGEKSGIRPLRMIPGLSWLIIKLFYYRMVQKYIIRDFHPLVLFYLSAICLLCVFFPILFVRMLVVWIVSGSIPPINALAAIVVLLAGLQLMLFAMWFDMEANRELK